MNRRQQLEADTRALALPEGRRVGDPGHDEAREYLVGRMEEIGLEPFHGDAFELPYVMSTSLSDAPIRFANLVGCVRGTEPDLPPFLVGAHYDSVIAAPCADDNATAVAVALAAAEEFQAQPARRDVIIALFDAEEPPFFLGPAMGSIQFYESFGSDMRFACAAIMDLIGHDVEVGVPEIDHRPEVAQLLCVLGSESHESLPPAVEAAASSTADLRVLPTLNSYVGDMSDHAAFRRDGQPYLFLTCGQGRHYHTVNDTVDWVNFDKVERVFEFLHGTLRRLDDPEAGSSRKGGSGGPGARFNQVAFEVRMIERALGDVYAPLLDRLGIDELRNRDDLDRLIPGLASRLVV